MGVHPCQAGWGSDEKWGLGTDHSDSKSGLSRSGCVPLSKSLPSLSLYCPSYKMTFVIILNLLRGFSGRIPQSAPWPGPWNECQYHLHYNHHC